MSTRFKQATGGLVLAIGLGAGCGADGPARVTDPKEVDAQIQQGLDRLRLLEIVDVSRLVLKLPGEATSCYGLPCPGSGWEAAYQQERARQAPRLTKLADIATQVSRDQYLAPRDPSEAAAAIQALAA